MAVVGHRVDDTVNTVKNRVSKDGPADRIRTCDRRFAKMVLFPLSYGGEYSLDRMPGV